eukprot:gene14724-20768_t
MTCRLAPPKDSPCDDLMLRILGMNARFVRLIFGTNFKAHLRPQLFYLTSLGVSNLQELVMERPLVLGEGIETVIKFLRMCGVPRKEMFRLIRSYPLDFNLKIKYVKEEAPPPQQPPK